MSLSVLRSRYYRASASVMAQGYGQTSAIEWRTRGCGRRVEDTEQVGSRVSYMSAELAPAKSPAQRCVAASAMLECQMTVDMAR